MSEKKEYANEQESEIIAALQHCSLKERAEEYSGELNLSEEIIYDVVGDEAW